MAELGCLGLGSVRVVVLGRGDRCGPAGPLRSVSGGLAPASEKCCQSFGCLVRVLLSSLQGREYSGVHFRRQFLFLLLECNTYIKTVSVYQTTNKGQ